MTTKAEERTNGATAASAVKPTIVEVIRAVMGEVQAVGKDDRNNQQGYNFRGIDAVVNAAGPAFRRHGVISAPMLEKATYRDVQTSTGKPSRECTVEVRYRFYGPAGDHLDVIVPGESMDFGDKGTPKAMSVAYRIALLQLLTIPTHEPEPDAQSYERAERRSPSMRATALFKLITEAETLEQLKAVWEDTQQAETDGEISASERGQLAGHVKKRKVELEPAAPAAPPATAPATTAAVTA